MMTIRVDADAREVWRRMLDVALREQYPVAVVTGRPEDRTEERYEGVLLEVEPGWLRVQPVDADDLPCAPSVYVAVVDVDHVMVYGKQSGSWLDAIGFARAGR